MNNHFHLVDSDWKALFNKAAKQSKQVKLRIICPFIKKRVIENLVQRARPTDIQIITRFNLSDFFNGVSDISALQFLLKSGAQIRGIRNLHAKLYLFGESRAIVTSANLTDAALSRNHEFGFIADDEQIISHCHNYFNDLWHKAGSNLSLSQTDKWDKKVTEQLVKGTKPSSVADLGDEGVEAAQTTNPPVESPPWVADANQAFVKFFGVSNDRADLSFPVLEEVKRAGCHWACTYPKNKRPRQVEDGDLMFMGRLVKDPNDIIIFGRAVGMAHDQQRDNATEKDKELRLFKEKWPHYIRVHHPEFVAGTMANGISLNKLMDNLEKDAFAATQENAHNGEGNINPRKAYMQQPAVRLSTQGLAWLNEQLETSFTEHGRIPQTDLDKLDWPVI